MIGKFLKIAGKDPNGNAKGIAVTENGEVKVQQTGSIGQTRDGKDEWITPITMWERQLSTGLYLPPGAIEDNSDVGKPRIKADELEGLLEEIRDKDFATDTKLELVRALLESINSKDYSTEVTLQAVLTELANLSDGTKAMKVQQTGSIVSVETVANAISIPANSNKEIDLGITGEEKEVLLAISTDQQPWTLNVGDAIQVTGVGGQQKKTTYYPKADGVTNTYGIYTPYIVYLLGNIHYRDGSVTDDYPSSFIEAKQIAIPPRAGITCRFINQSLNIATVTIKTIKVMR